MVDILKLVVTRRTEDKSKTAEDTESLGRFASRVSKLRGEGPMATSDEPEVALEVVSINIKDIEIPPHYPRYFSGNIEQLVASIRVFGIQQPIKVIKIKGSKKYRLVFGKRRIEAAVLAGLDAVPCIVELAAKEERLQMLLMAENLHRSNLYPLEEGAGYQHLLSQKNTGMDEVCNILGLSKQVVQEMIEILNLPAAIQKDIMSRPQIFTYAMLKVLLQAFRLSNNSGKKLFNAIVSGEVTSQAQAQPYLKA